MLLVADCAESFLVLIATCRAFMFAAYVVCVFCIIAGGLFTCYFVTNLRAIPSYCCAGSTGSSLLSFSPRCMFAGLS